MRCNLLLCIAVFLLLFCTGLQAQQLSLGNTPSMLNKSAVLELNATNQGLLFPRLSDTVAINNLNPPDGMVIYFTPTKQVLVRSRGYWNPVLMPVDNGKHSWLLNGNSGISSSQFLGTIDDKALLLKSNNSTFLELGKRSTLGLVQSYTDYNDGNEQVMHLTGALQFAAPNASFYKPKMFVDGNGNFRVKGSSAGTDYFEFGSTGTNNNGGFEFMIGDDGDEPILFKSYHYQNGATEMMRLQNGRMAVGSSTFNTTNPEKLLIDAGNTTSYNLITGKGNIDNYLQLNIQNRSATGNASADVVATADNGDESVNYIDMGINSSAYNNITYPIIGGINNTYLYGTGNDFLIGNATANKPLRFFTGGYALTNERLRIDGTGKVGIGNTAPSEVLDISGNLKFSGALMPGGAAGTAGFLLQSNGTGVAPSWLNPSSVLNAAAWVLDGNSLSAIKKFGTTSNHALPFITNNVERMRLGTDGYLGLGTSAPAGRLHLVSDNSETGNDYLFDDYSNANTPGLFMRRARGTIAAPANLQPGDVIGSLSFIPRFNGSLSYAPGSAIEASYLGSGTDNKTNLRFTTSGAEQMRIDDDGNVGIGATIFDATSPEKLLVDAGTSTYTAMLAKGNINSYFQINVKNNSSGNQGSSDLVATANNGTETTNFVNLGINGSNYVYQSGNPIETGKFNDGYLLSAGNDLYIVNNNATKDIIFLAGGTAPVNEAMRITAGERIGIGTTTPNTSTKLDVSGSVKIGTAGTVVKNMVTATSTFGANTTVNAATTGSFGSSISPGTLDITYTLPAANTLASTVAAVAVSPSADLPAGVTIAFARATSTTAIKVRFINNSTTSGTIASGTKLYFTITDF